MTSLGSIFNLMTLYPYLRWENSLCLKYGTSKNKTMLWIPVLSPAHLEKNMTKYECFVWKPSNKCCLGIMSVPHSWCFGSLCPHLCVPKCDRPYSALQWLAKSVFQQKAEEPSNISLLFTQENNWVNNWVNNQLNLFFLISSNKKLWKCTVELWM